MIVECLHNKIDIKINYAYLVWVDIVVIICISLFLKAFNTAVWKEIVQVSSACSLHAVY